MLVENALVLLGNVGIAIMQWLCYLSLQITPYTNLLPLKNKYHVPTSRKRQWGFQAKILINQHLWKQLFRNKPLQEVSPLLFMIHVHMNCYQSLNTEFRIYNRHLDWKNRIFLLRTSDKQRKINKQKLWSVFTRITTFFSFTSYWIPHGNWS